MKQGLASKHHVSADETSITDVRDLQTFCLTVDLRSFTAVARLTGESTPTVSRRIARVEQALGVQLLNRNPRRVEPTEEGALYRQRLAQVLELLDDANATVRRSDVEPSGRLRVTAPPEFGALLAPIFVDFGERHPAVTVEALMSQRRLDFDADHVDVALRFSFGLADSSLVAHRLLDLDVAFVASPKYLRRHKLVLKELDDLSSHRILMLTLARSNARAASRTSKGWRFFEKLISRLRPSLMSSDMNFIRELALAGGGVAFLPSVCVAKDLERGHLVRVLKGHGAMPSASLYLVHQNTRVLPPKVRAFRSHVLSAFGVAGRNLSARRSKGS